MTALAPHLEAFLREHLPHERKASPHTCEAYAYSFQILVCFAARQLKIRPSQLEVEQLDATLILAFLKHIADSGDGDHLFRSIVITGSGDRDHAQGGYGTS
jgi:integrase/recombinase XerD